MNMAATASNPAWVDFHTHCLPAIDDGAADVETACGMLRMAAEQGAKTVVASPHFYWGQDTVESFLQARQEAYERLKPHLAGLPTVKLGAEVLLREGISSQDLRPLCLEDTDLLLVELPFAPPPGWLIEELENIVYNQRLTVMLAHLDRYLPWYSKEQVEMLTELPDVIVQLNGDTLADRGAYRALRRWLPDVPRMVLGSDMHSTGHRAPHMTAAFRNLSRKRLGRLWLERVEETTENLFEKTTYDLI